MLVCCGLVTLDVVQVVDALPGPDEKVVARSLAATFGGPAANAAATAVALGVPTTLVTAVGHGPLAAVVRAELESSGVTLVDAADGVARAVQPAVSTVLVTRATGERAVVSTNASGFGDLADARLVGPGRTTDLLDELGPGDVLLLDGHHPGLALRVARRARERGCAVVLDGGSWKPDAPAMIGLCDAVVVSADFRPPGIATDDVLDAVAALGPRFVARTRGPRPVEVLDAGERYEVAVPRPGRVVDTLGAGDVVHGAFAAAVARGSSWRAALEDAVLVASRSVEHAGARGWSAATS
ncbi:PfkB family carbohydrate kinase [Cellulosimicrobium cellulans]|uniref:PfkB family carbohydrate kinase n=1 Tax=Cellulosimicrobium cellulans TaxID=1710 RepID=UPI001BA4C1A1|nr:PfkB family carbohydrate kinase [Cellulosimicrobium cellulans]QUC01293.1 carbohydrate kinase [Cellulosimicrobium cellulans]